jgi:hypothetical protein
VVVAQGPEDQGILNTHLNAHNYFIRYIYIYIIDQDTDFTGYAAVNLYFDEVYWNPGERKDYVRWKNLFDHHRAPFSHGTVNVFTHTESYKVIANAPFEINLRKSGIKRTHRGNIKLGYNKLQLGKTFYEYRAEKGSRCVKS